MKNQVSKEALFTYFAGGATAFQKQLIDEWAKEEANREFFFECLAAWENQNIQVHTDVDKAIERHQQRMMHPSEPAQFDAQAEPLTRPFFGSGWIGWLIAASVSVVLLLVGIAYKEQLLYKTYHTAFGEMRTITLSDGSRITLNANSSVRVPPFGFGGENRTIFLAGEADFSIKHLPDNQPFVVKTGRNFEVVVLGTEFLVNTREKAEKVLLNSGKVRLLYQEGKTSKQVTMLPGNVATFDPQGHVSLKQTPKPQDLMAWKEHRFLFDGKTLADIATLFKDNYGIDLQIPDKAMAQWTISGSFKAYSAEELIETLATAANLTYRQQGNTIVITQNQ